MQLLRDWVRRILPNSQAIALAVLLTVGFLGIIFLGNMLMPVLAAGVIAYLLDGVVISGVRRGVPRLAAILVVYLGFLAFVTYILFALLPLLLEQTAQLVRQLPIMINQGQELLLRLPDIYPNVLSQEQVFEIIAVVRRELIGYGQQILSLSAASLIGLITLIVYMILVPMLVFFFLKDKDQIIAWLTQYLPRERHLSARVWREVDMQIGNYVRGKFLEILVLWGVSYTAFLVMGLNYGLLLGFLIGLSVLIPYVGATVVTFPVLVVGYFQWGLSDHFWYLVGVYTVIQALDATILVPLLFSEAVNLHPVAIIVAILFFGGLWGFWGVFFAIPLATLVKAVLSAWPRIEGGNSALWPEPDARTVAAPPPQPSMASAEPARKTAQPSRQ